MPAHVTVPRVILAVAISAAAIDAALFVTALGQLSNGPDALGYTLLLWANKLASIVAVLAIAVVAARTLGGGRILVPSLGLLLASGITGAVALGLFLLGGNLAGYDSGDQLQSLLLALRGTGQDLAPVPLFLVAGTAVLPFAGYLRAHRLSPAVA